MQPEGAEDPVVYMLGDYVTRDDVETRKHFGGSVGKLLRERIPSEFKYRVRWNYCVRSNPHSEAHGDRAPSQIEIESCRPSVIRDIEETKPKAIFGFGRSPFHIPLYWMSGFNGISAWRGRRMPVRVGNHVCWFYPLDHPHHLIEIRRGRDDRPTAIGSEDERMFNFDLKAAFAEVDDLPPPDIHTTERVLKDVVLLDNHTDRGVREIKAALEWAKKQPVIGVDYETNALRPYGDPARVLTCGFGTAEVAYAFGVDHPGAEWTPEQRAEVVRLWVDFLRNAEGVKAVHNLSFELEWTGWVYGQDLVRAGNWHDTASQANVIDSRTRGSKPGPLSLEFLIQQYCGFNIKKLAGLDTRALTEVPLPNVLEYNAVDARYHAILHKKQWPRLKQMGLLSTYKQTLRRVPTLVLTQLKGVPLDQKQVRRLDRKWTNRIAEAEQLIQEQPELAAFTKRTHAKFNPSSSTDVITLFADILKREECKVWDKKKGAYKYSGDESVLQAINSPLTKSIIKLRKAMKLRSTYIEPLLTGSPIVWPDGLLHPQFNILLTNTGRLSAEDPNVQNFPKRDGELVEVRRPIVATPGHIGIAVDLGQIEARVIAMFTKDKVFVKALWERYDIHQEWAERIAHAYPKRIGGKKNLTDKAIMKKFRGDIKNQWTFPLVFGCSVESAATYLQIPIEIISKQYDEFWKHFSGIKDWQDDLMRAYRKNGYVENLIGRRRYGPINMNMVFNTPIQSTAAELILEAMNKLSESGDPALQPELNIHDDLSFFRIPEKKVDDYLEKIIDAMINMPFDWINVPITAEASIGYNWLELEEVGTFSSDQWNPK